MKGLTKTILSRAAGLAKGTPLSNEMFLDIGSRAGINQSLLQCVRKHELLRVARGIYVLPVVSRFGSSAPSAHLFIEKFSKQRGEVIVPSGATSASALGLTTQVPVQIVFWTSGRSRELNLGKLALRLSHVPPWQLALATEPAGEIVRVLAWAGRQSVHTVLKHLEEKVPRSELLKVALQIPRFPGWLASALVRSVGSAS
jgi:hypothetical protein